MNANARAKDWVCRVKDMPPAWQTMRRFAVCFQNGAEVVVDYLFPGERYRERKADAPFWCAFEFYSEAISSTGFHSGWGYSPTIQDPSDFEFLPSTPEEYVTPLMFRLMDAYQLEQIKQARGKAKDALRAAYVPLGKRLLELACYAFVRDYENFEDKMEPQDRADWLASFPSASEVLAAAELLGVEANPETTAQPAQLSLF